MSCKVGLYHCPVYDVNQIEEILEKALQDNPEWLEGYGEGTRVFLKLNLLMKRSPDHAVTTHPALVEAVVRILKRRGAVVTIGDSPGGPYLPGRLKDIYRICGLEDMAKRTGAVLNFDVSDTSVSFAGGKVSRSFKLITPVVQADKVISMPKLKTHSMTRFTGAVKNLFGAVPGMEKVDYHLKMPELDVFCEMLVDLVLCVKPSLHIMDAITGMEGSGPSAGKPVQVGAILVSDDPFALDTAALSMVGIYPPSVPTVQRAQARGLIGNLADVRIVGDRLEDWSLKPLDVPRIRSDVKFPIIPEFINRALRPKPVFLAEKCSGCGDCVKYCPPKALELTRGFPRLNLEACIRCFCCQELCPHQAVKVKRSPWG